LGPFVEHLVGAQKIKVWGTPFKSAQPPVKTAKTNCKPMGHNPRVDLCPKSIKKMKKNGEIWRNGVSGKMGEMREIGEIGGRRWVEMAGGGAVGGWEVMGGGGAWWVWILGSVWRWRTEKERERCTAATGE
jgi:hypothetical protein